MTDERALSEALDKLRRYAAARNRAADKEPRTIVLSDDEALALLDAIESQRTD